MFGEGFDQTLETLRGAATAVAAAVDNAAVADASVADAKRVWEELTCAHRLLGGAIATLVRRINTPEAWAGSGARSASELVARTAGVGEGEARRMLETAERLADQPEVADALKAGRMSSTQAQLVADAVAANPDAATELVAAAETHALPRLRELCNDAKHRADADPEATYARVHRARRCRTFIDSDQTFRIFGQGTIDDGARITNELDRLTDLEFRRARKEGRRESLEAYRFDALVKMARRSARLDQPWPVAGAGGMSDTAAASRPSAGPPEEPAPARQTGDLPDPSTAGDPECAPHGPQGPASPPEDSGWGAPSTSSRENPTFLAILRIEHAALVRGWIEGEETCEIAGLGPVPVRVARELLGESILKLIITRGRDANVTHLGRGPTVAQRVALLWRQPRCSVRGCAGRHIQIDHRDDWARTRHTRLDELDPLCNFHHDLKTRENWAFTAVAGPGSDGADGGGGDGGDGNSGDGSGERDFVPPSDPRHPDRVWADRRRNGTTG